MMLMPREMRGLILDALISSNNTLRESSEKMSRTLDDQQVTLEVERFLASFQRGREN